MNKDTNNIVEDLIEIEEDIASDDDISSLSIHDAQNAIINQFKKENLISNDINSTLLDPKNEGFITIIKDNVNYCVNELKEVNIAMNKISNQKNTELFFRKSENIKLISQYMSKVATVNQKTLDLLILLLGASSKISDDYETILSTIDELGSLNNGEAEVLNYLLKVKKMVYEIRDNDLRMKKVIEDNNQTKDTVIKAEEKIIQEIKESEKSRKIIESKCIKLQRQMKFNNLYIGICLLLIIILAIFMGLKFYVF